MIKEITAIEFDEYAKNHVLSNFHQSSNYASLMAKSGYERLYLALKDDNNHIIGATLLLTKKIKHIFKYGYAPQGFLIDYKNDKEVRSFTNAMKQYAKDNKIIFIKINPEIATYIYDHNLKKKKLSNYSIINTLTDNGYIKLKDNIYFESMLPRFNGIIDLKKYNLNKITKKNRNKVHNAVRKGLEIETTNKNKIKDLYPFIEKKKKRRNLNYYKNYFSIFNETLDADIFLVSINYEKYLTNSKDVFEKELEHNKMVTERLFQNNTEENIKRKMESDRVLLSYKNDVINATYGLNKGNNYIAGALCIKHNNHVHIVISGYDELYSYMNPNYFLHNEIINYYKNNFDYLDLNGLTGDFTITNPYYGLNEFKLGFKPTVYEFIGEFDLVVNETIYNLLLSLGWLQKEFKKD